MHSRLMKLSGLRLLGPRDISILYSIRRTMSGPFLGHIRAMFWPFLQYLCFQMHEMPQIFTEESCMPNRRIQINVQLSEPYWGHVLGHSRAMFWLFLQYLCFQMPTMAQIFTEESGCQNGYFWNCLNIFCKSSQKMALIWPKMALMGPKIIKY